MAEAVLVTGATGNAGREVVAALLRRGIPVRAAARDPAAPRPLPAHPLLQLARLDYADAATWGPAAGCRAVFLLRPPAIADVRRTLNPFVDAARAEGVGPVVFLSVAGAGQNRLIPHHKVEAHLQAGPAPWTLLRPGFFAQNLQDAYRRDIREDGRLFVPAGRGRVAFVDLRDVAEVAASALVDPATHGGRAYTLTGPEAASFAQVGELLGAQLGRPVRYVPASVPGYLLHLRRRGLPWGQVAVQAILHVGLRFGQAEAIDPTLPALLGRPARTIRDYIGDHLDVWRTPWT